VKTLTHNKKKLYNVAEKYGFRIKEISGVSGVVIGFEVSRVFKNCTDAVDFMCDAAKKPNGGKA
jgi:hypothetical protein